MGATSARPFGGRQGGGREAQGSKPQTAAQPKKNGRGIGRKVFCHGPGGWSKVWGWQRPGTAAHLMGRLFSESWGISAHRTRLAATPAMVRQFDAPLSNGMRAERAHLFTVVATAPAVWVLPSDPPNTGARGPANGRAGRISHPTAFCFGFGLAGFARWRTIGKAKVTVGTVRTLSPTQRRRCAFGRSGLFPLAAWRVGTVGTARGSLRGRKIRALVASPARAHRSGGADL